MINRYSKINILYFTVFFFISFILFISCKNKENTQNVQETNSIVNNGFITIIVPSYEFNYQHQGESIFFRKITAITFYNGYYSETITLKEERDYKLLADTIQVYSFVPNPSISVGLETEYPFNYSISPGDTIRINFKDDLPSISSSKKSVYDWQNPKQYSFYNPNFRSLLNAVYNHTETVQYYINYYDEIKIEVDSLFLKKKISTEVYNLAKKDIYANQINQEIHKISRRLKDRNWSAFSLKDSTYLYSSCYRGLLLEYFYEENLGERETKIFDKIWGDKRLDIGTKKYLLYNMLTHIFNKQDFKTRAEKFLSIANNDSIWVKLVQDISPLETIDSKDMQLYDTAMKQIDFQELMNSYKGKVVYIDVWASWCAPCKAVMPTAKNLRDKYKNKDIVFLYLAYNDQEKAWQNEIHKSGLDDGVAYNFLIASPKSQWVQDMNLKTIPRYMIYDKSGKLVSKEAPDPKKESELSKLIDKLLD